MKFRVLNIFILVALLFTACKNNDNQEPQPDDTNGIIKMGISTDSLYFGVAATTKAEPSLVADDFKIHLENTRAEELASWGSYAEMPAAVRMVFGSYKLVASYGELKKLPAFDAPVYGAEAKFALSAQSPIADVQLDCRPVATKVSIKFSDRFNAEYSAYKVDVKTVGDSLEHTMADIDREAYFRPGLLRFKFTLTPTSGASEPLVYYYNTNVRTKAAEFYKVTFNAISVNGTLGITITSDDTTIDRILERELPEFWLPRPAPIVMQHSFGDANEIAVTEAQSAVANVVIKTYGGVKSAVIKTTSVELLSQGYPAQGVDILRASEPAYSETITFLKKLGVAWSETLDDKQTALDIAGNSPVVIDFKGATKNLNTEPGVTTSHGFELVIADKFGQKHEPFVFTIKVAPPVLELSGMGEAAVWAKHAFIECKYRSERNGYKPVPQISGDNGATWFEPKYETILDDIELRSFRINELTPLTPYKFRVVLGKHIVEHTEAITTEVDAQVENNSFEDWHMNYYKGTWPGYNIARYYPWKEGQNAYWNTGNDRTTCYRIQAGGANQYTMASGTMYSYNSKTGAKAAEIRTVSANVADTPVNSSGVDAVTNRTRGRLLIGSYSYSKGSSIDNINYGRTFSSRPTSMTFWYQYKPVNGDGDTFEAVVKIWHQEGAEKTELGQAIYTKFTKENIGIYELVEIPIVYTNTSKKANRITVEFISTNDATPRTNTNVTTTYPDVYNEANWKGHIGSILTVDDVQLIY